MRSHTAGLEILSRTETGNIFGMLIVAVPISNSFHLFKISAINAYYLSIIYSTYNIAIFSIGE